MPADLRPLDIAISQGVVPASDRDEIIRTLESVPEGRRQRTLEDIVESYARARKYLDNVRELIQEKAAKRVAESDTRRVPPTERKPKRNRADKYAEDLLKMEHILERKLDPKILVLVFRNSPKGARANVRRLLDRVMADIQVAKEALR